MTSNTNSTKYVRVEATVVSTKYAKTLFVIQDTDVPKFELCDIKPKSKEFNGQMTYSVAAKLQPEGINALYGAINLEDLVVGGKYKVVFKVYNWKYNGEAGIGMCAFVSELISEPSKQYIDESLISMLRKD